MRTIEIHPESNILQSFELRVTELESFINNPFRPSVSELNRQETMSIWDVLHSYIQHLQMWFDLYEYHTQMLEAITDRDINLYEYRDLAVNELPKFQCIEQSFKIRIVSEFSETFFCWTADWVIPWWLWDLKFSWKKRAPSRLNQAKQKIYYTFLYSLMMNDWTIKDFTYFIFTTKEKKVRLFKEVFTLDPRECEEIFINDFKQRIYEKEKGIWVPNVKIACFV